MFSTGMRERVGLSARAVIILGQLLDGPIRVIPSIRIDGKRVVPRRTLSERDSPKSRGSRQPKIDLTHDADKVGPIFGPKSQ